MFKSFPSLKNAQTQPSCALFSCHSSSFHPHSSFLKDLFFNHLLTSSSILITLQFDFHLQTSIAWKEPLSTYLLNPMGTFYSLSFLTSLLNLTPLITPASWKLLCFLGFQDRQKKIMVLIISIWLIHRGLHFLHPPSNCWLHPRFCLLCTRLIMYHPSEHSDHCLVLITPQFASSA